MTHRAAMLYQEAKIAGHRGPCGPIALSILTNQPYVEAVKLVEAKGDRQLGKGGTYATNMLSILHELGYSVSDVTEDARANGAKTIQSTGWALRQGWSSEGKLLIQTRNHFAAVQDGIIHDWSAGRKMHIVRIYKITVSA